MWVTITVKLFYKMATSRFVEITDKQISKIKINLVPKNTKDVC